MEEIKHYDLNTLSITNDHITTDILSKKIQERINPSLTPKDKEKMFNLLKQHQYCFAESSRDLGHCKILTHQINTGTADPIHQQPHPSPFMQRELLQTQVTVMLKDEVIEPSNSPWSSPVILVKKKDGSYRFCVDYRKLNNAAIKPLAKYRRCSQSPGENQIYLYNGHAIRILANRGKPKLEKKTAFITPDGLWQFKKMPFGLCNSPASFQRKMDIVLTGLKWNSCLIYLDDVVVFSSTYDEHLTQLNSVLTAIKEAGLRLKVNKCRFGETKLSMLGHIVEKNRVYPDPEKVRAIQEFPQPIDVKSIQSFIGLCSYYRKFICNFAEIARPITSLTRHKK